MMGNYSTGTITIVQGSATITGVGTLWLTAGVKAGMPIAFKGNLYRVAADAASETSMTLTGNVAEADESGVAYTVGMTFDPTVGAPLVTSGDPQWTALLSESISVLGREVRRNHSVLPVLFDDFNDSADSWTGSDATLETISDDGDIDASALRYTTTDASSYMEKTGLSIDPTLYQTVRIRARYDSGNADGLWVLKYYADGTWQTYTHYADLLISDGAWRYVEMDLSAEAAWSGAAEITAFRLSPPANADNDLVVEIDLFIVGKHGIETGIGTYLPLAGGTLTGAVSGTSLSLSGALTTLGYTTVNRTGTTKYLGLQEQTSGENCGLELFTKDGDGTDYVTFSIFGKGLPTDITNSERLELRYTPATSHSILASATGTGTVLPLILQTGANTGQITLEADGDVYFTGKIGVGVSPFRRLTVDAGADVATAVFVSGGGGGDALIHVYNDTAAGSTTPTAGIALEPGPSTGYTVCPRVEAYRQNDGSSTALRDYGLKLYVTTNNARVLGFTLDPDLLATFEGAMLVKGGFQGGDAVGDDIYLKGRARGLTRHLKETVATAATESSGFVAQAAGSLTAVSGVYTGTAGGGDIVIYVNGSDSGASITATSAGSDFTGYLAKGQVTFSAGDRISFYTAAGVTNAEIDIEVIYDTYSNVNSSGVTYSPP